MKILALFLSLFTLVTMSVDFLNKEIAVSETKVDTEITNFELPKKLAKTLTEPEIKWQRLLMKNKKGNAEQKENEIQDTYSLMVGEASYEFLGIFDDGKVLFILLKNSAENLLKLSVGDVLPGEYALNDIRNNTIVFVNNNKRVEYKLFEKKHNVKN